ncbi:hypothetical protein DL346_22900 [Paenibacillus montanisoli]|uniref:Uncharacterized protein n=1 Tax=Paenibacillus montanisoli TaxID=2081970 RepID=A0A328TUD9_9BACL|nr:hypothetical protein DL346_22900 [Paenibacillus montanisoli]
MERKLGCLNPEKGLGQFLFLGDEKYESNKTVSEESIEMKSFQPAKRVDIVSLKGVDLEEVEQVSANEQG